MYPEEFLRWLYQQARTNTLGRKSERGDEDPATEWYNSVMADPERLAGFFSLWQTNERNAGRTPRERTTDYRQYYPDWLLKTLNQYPSLDRQFGGFVNWMSQQKGGGGAGPAGPSGPGPFDLSQIRNLTPEQFKAYWEQSGQSTLTPRDPNQDNPLWGQGDWEKLFGGQMEPWIRELLSRFLKSFGEGGDAGQGYESMGRALLLKEFQRMFGSKTAQSTSPFGDYYLPKQIDPSQYFDPKGINQFWNVSAGNLGSRMQQAGGQAGNQAAALAASRGLVNPSGFQTGARSQAMAPFAQQFGNLEAGRAGALQQNQQNLFGALTGQQQFGEQARQFQIGNQFQQGQDQWNRAMQGLGLGQFFSTQNRPDKAWDIFGMLAKLAGAYLGGKG